MRRSSVISPIEPQCGSRKDWRAEHRAKPIEARFETLRTNRVYVPLTTLSDGFHLLEAGEEANAAYLQSRLLLLWIQQDNAELSLADALGLLKGPRLRAKRLPTEYRVPTSRWRRIFNLSRS